MLGQGAVESIDLISCEPIAHFFFFGEFGAMLGQGAVESIDLISCEPIADFFFFGEFGAMLGQSAVESIDLSVTPCKVFCEAFDLLAALRNGAAQFRQLGTVCQLLRSELSRFLRRGVPKSCSGLQSICPVCHHSWSLRRWGHREAYRSWSADVELERARTSSAT